MSLKKTIFLMMAASCAYLPLQADTGIIPVATEEAPRAIGPYSQATKAGSYMFISGQIALDPKTGHLVEGKIEEQTKQVLKNINMILESQGLTFENVVKTEVYLKDLNDFKSMNGIYAEYFSFETKPARATIEVSKLPMGALIEISCIAYLPNT